MGTMFGFPTGPRGATGPSRLGPGKPPEGPVKGKGEEVRPTKALAMKTGYVSAAFL